MSSVKSIAIGAVFVVSSWIGSSVAADPPSLGISVDDVARFATIDDPLWSPDGSKAVVVLRRGDAAANMNNAELMVLTKDLALQSVVQFASSTNDQPISGVRWLPGNDTLVFAVADGTTPAQMYKLRLDGTRPTQLTAESTSIDYTDVTPSGSHMIATFKPVKPVSPSTIPECRDRGCRVEAETLAAAEFGAPEDTAPLVFFDIAAGTKSTITATEQADTNVLGCRDGRGGGISPDGAYVLRLCRLRLSETPSWWKDYTAYPGLRALIEAGSTSYLRQFMLIDLKRNTTQRLGTAPFFAGNSPAEPIWIDGGKRLILPAAFEPLTGVSVKEREARAASYAALLVDPASGKIERIAQLDAQLLFLKSASWDDATQTLTINGIDKKRKPLRLSYRRNGTRWALVNVPAAEAKQNHPQVIVAQSLNDPPVLMAVEAVSSARRVLLDPNPWLAQRKLGEAKLIEWKLKSGATWNGALYYPIDYKPGTRYPLVIQTHGLHAERFSLTGESPNFAAQPLAAQGVMVLQANEAIGTQQGVNEFTAVRDGYESAVDHLTAQGLIDRTKVGLIGWSRSGPYVGFTLTQSEYLFAAAAFTDTGDFGWWWYLQGGARHGESAYGQPPYGAGFDLWRKYAPTFNLDRVRTPMMMWTAGGPRGLWDWYAVLRRLGKPVEYWMLPDGQHEVFKIGQRTRTNQLLVDWFRFWLKDEEDPDVTKTAQYARWRDFRQSQCTHESWHPSCVAHKR